MARSLGLALYLLTAARGGAASSAQRSPRPEGRLVWLHIGTGASPASMAQLAQHLAREDDRLAFLVTAERETPPDGLGFPEDTATDVLPPDRVGAVAAFLAHWRPDLAVLSGTSLPPALVVEAERIGIPLVLADVRLASGGETGWRWRRGMTASLLGRFRHILAQDSATAARLAEIGGRDLPIEVTGRIEETSEPLSCNEVERDEIAQMLKSRPVWLAVACPEAEEDAVIAAQAEAMRLAHRMLLILVPSHGARTAALAERFARDGWIAARRSAEEMPEPEAQVYLAEDTAELGLWYRLAPVTFMGGTLLGEGAARNPFEPAALGSAIVHGPNSGPYPEAFGRLRTAHATRYVATPESLAEAICDLIAPDKTALLAHNAWAASSGGAEVTERVTSLLLATLAAPTRGASRP